MNKRQWIVAWAVGPVFLLGALATPRVVHTQEPAVVLLDLPIGRSRPITTPQAIRQVSVANPEIADVIVITERELVISAKALGSTDAIVWQQDGARTHYRVQVGSGIERMQVAVGIKFAEVRRDALRELGVNALWRDQNSRIGTGIFRSDDVFTDEGDLEIPGEGSFLSILTNFDTDRLLAFIELQEQKGQARTLAEPNVMAANKEEANFLAGGELPIPIAQPGTGDDVGVRVTIQFKEFGIRLRFIGEIINDSLIKLTIRPEVSSLDFANGILISGFRIPAFRTRRVETTVDVRPNESLIISGLFNEEQERVRTGIPGLMDLPIIGALFSSTRWQRNESELLVVVTPALIDPRQPRARDVLRFAPDTTLPAREAIEKRLPRSPRSEPPPE